jgi:hypothetical protein
MVKQLIVKITLKFTLKLALILEQSSMGGLIIITQVLKPIKGI